MPLQLAGTEAATGRINRRIVRVPGLPDFNASDDAFKITAFEGWFDGLTPVPVLVGTGGGPGALASGDWAPAEHYYTLRGRIFTDPAGKSVLRRMLLEALPFHRETPVQVLGNGLDQDLQVFVRTYDRPEFPPGEAPLSFSFPLVAADPFKYALVPVAGEVGVFTGQRWFRTYADNGAGRWVRTYSGGIRVYAQSVPSGPYAQSITLTSSGDAASQRMTATVRGPLIAGDWWLLSETTGDRLWVDVTVGENQELVLDMAAKTATLNGADVTYLVFGDWLTLQPGPNVYRLVAGTDSTAFAHIEASEAFS